MLQDFLSHRNTIYKSAMAAVEIEDPVNAAIALDGAVFARNGVLIQTQAIVRVPAYSHFHIVQASDCAFARARNHNKSGFHWTFLQAELPEVRLFAPCGNVTR